MSEQAPHGPRWQRTAELPAAGFLFAGIFGLELIASEQLTFWGVLYAVPVVLVARRSNRTGGLVAAGLAAVLMVAAALVRDIDLDLVGTLARVGTFAAVGVLAASGLRRSADRAEAPETVLTAHSPVVGSPPSERDVLRRETLALTGVATWELDLATGVMRWSDEYQDLYGVDSRAPLTSRAAFQQIMHPEDRDLFLQALESIASDGTTLEARYRITRPDDGTERVIRSHMRAENQAGGERLVIGTAQDVTQLVMVLTPRESEMLMLLAEGLSVERIADQLVLSPATVRTHIQNAMVKLGAHTRGQAIATALRSDEIGS